MFRSCSQGNVGLHPISLESFSAFSNESIDYSVESLTAPGLQNCSGCVSASLDCRFLLFRADSYELSPRCFNYQSSLRSNSSEGIVPNFNSSFMRSIARGMPARNLDRESSCLAKLSNIGNINV